MSVPLLGQIGYADVVGETSPEALPICGDSQYPRGPTASECELTPGRVSWTALR